MEDLSVRFGAVVALSDVTVEVRVGEILGLIGPNGAGKSTFVDALTGFLPHHTGTVDARWPEAGCLATAPSRACRTAPHVPAGSRALDDDRRRVRPLRRRWRRAQAAHPRRARLPRLPDSRTPLQIVDVGTRRLIEVAANIAAGPKLLLLDEPAAGLSHEEHLAFADRLRAVPERFGVTLLIIEHDLDLVRSVCSNLVVLNFGEVLAAGPQEQVLSEPAVLKAYMGETEMLS